MAILPTALCHVENRIHLGKWQMKNVKVMQQSMMKRALSLLVLWDGGFEDKFPEARATMLFSSLLSTVDGGSINAHEEAVGRCLQP